MPTKTSQEVEKTIKPLTKEREKLVVGYWLDPICDDRDTVILTI
jgi:hypothetical protein